MKIMNRIAVILAILLVSASVVPALAGSPVDTPGDPLAGSDQQTEAGAGATGDDSQPPEEPLSDPTGPEDGSSGPEGDPTGPEDDSLGPDENLPGPDSSPEDDTPPVEDGDAPEATPTPEGPEEGLPTAENGTVTPEPEETPTVDPTPETTTTPAPTNTTNTTPTVTTTPVPTNTTTEPTPEPGIVVNESVSTDPPTENETAAAPPSRAAVLCIWEQLDTTGGALDDDPVEPGSQFLPPCAYGATKTVQIRAVVAGNSMATYPIVADVTSPDGSPFCRVNLTRQNSTVDALEAASVAGLVTYAHDTSLNEAVRALEGADAVIYVGEVDLSYNQAPGDYQVSVQVLPEEADLVDRPPGSIFTYLPTASFEIDFAAVDYGVVERDTDAWVRGDAEFGTAQSPTMRNTGNVPIRVIVRQDDMGLDVPAVYTAKLGSDGIPVAFGPTEAVTIPGVVAVDETVPLSFALRVSSGEGTPSGRLWVSCVPATGDD